MSTSKKKAKKPAARSASRSKSSDPSTEGSHSRTNSVAPSVVSSSGKPRRRLSASERRAYFDRLSQPRQTTKKFDADTQKLVNPDTGQIMWTKLTPEQIAANERKAIRDKKIEQMWLNGIRPEVKDKSKPDFQLYFKPNEETYDKEGGKENEEENNKRGKGRNRDVEEHKGRVEMEEVKRKEQEQAWLDGLRPNVDKKGRPLPDWNIDTEITRAASPEKLFNDDDDY